MKPSKIQKFFFGIGPRIALISWIVTIVTLTIFVIMIIPHQKKICFQHLESKAKSVAVALHDAITDAAINEDYASLVSASQTLIEGDPELEFLVIVKNDGFAVVNQQGGWHAEKNMDSFWRPETPQDIVAIDTVPIIDRQVFHYAQPFNSSGIKWGWIHVGLSLQAYNRSVNRVYRQTVMLGLNCAIFSLVFCLAYAHKVVQPIIRLRKVVHQIANGNLNVRAETTRKDEIGSLAASVNIMTEGLLHRDLLMDTVRDAAQNFLHSNAWETAIQKIMAHVGQSIHASRVYIFENHTNDDGQLCMSQRYEWVAEKIPSEIDNPELQNLPYAESGLDAEVIALLEQNKVICATLSEMNDETRAIVEPQGIFSLMLVPIMVENVWWGYLGVDDCIQERKWLESEQDSIATIADMLGATISRQKAQHSLMEAKITLEERVKDRTKELQDQVIAKEKTMCQLAETQGSLLEMSRTAGMAEVATGVLHNVGNVLNGINVSSNLIRERIRQTRIGNISKIAEMLTDPQGGLIHFLTEDPRGQQIPTYLASLSVALQKEHEDIAKEVDALHQKIDHIKEIVSMQQTYGRVFGVVETVTPEALMEDALTLNAGALTRHKIDVFREYQETPPITVDKHTILQILLNFINNAKHACSEYNGPKQVTLRIFSPTQDRVVFQVQDTGIGIRPENLNRIFQHGFTTRKQGHGFGLHSGALAARSLGGSLTAASDGHGCGATFTLEIPTHPGENK